MEQLTLPPEPAPKVEVDWWTAPAGAPQSRGAEFAHALWRRRGFPRIICGQLRWSIVWQHADDGAPRCPSCVEKIEAES